MPYAPPPRWAAGHPWLWGLLLGIVLGGGWVGLTARHGVTLGNLLIGLAVAVIVALGSGFLSRFSPWNPQ
jgi:hypothetical protein